MGRAEYRRLVLEPSRSPEKVYKCCALKQQQSRQAEHSGYNSFLEENENLMKTIQFLISRDDLTDGMIIFKLNNFFSLHFYRFTNEIKMEEGR